MTIDYDRWDGSTGGNLSPTQVVEDCLRFGESHGEFADRFTSEGFVQKDHREQLARDASEAGREFGEADWSAYVVGLRQFIVDTLDAARPEGTICRRVDASITWTFPADSELESWEAVGDEADSATLVTGLLGRAPYTALYNVVSRGRTTSFFVAEPVYGIKEFAAALGIERNHFSAVLSRGQGSIPRPALATADDHIWTHSQVEECKRARLLKARQPRPVVTISENPSGDPEAKRFIVAHHQGAMPAHAEHGFDSLVQAKGSVSREYLLRRPVRKDEAAGDVLFIGRLRAKRPKS